MSFALMLAKQSKSEIETRVAKAASILGLAQLLDRYPRQLSGGQRQRVAMGRAIVRDPQVFLFDEPLSNLDAKLRVQMRTEIKELHQRLKTTSIYVTHDQIEAMTMADKIVVMNAGKVEQIGSPLELYDHPANLFVAGFIGSPAMNFLPERRDGRDVLVGVRPEHLEVVNGAANGALPAEVVVVEPTGADTQIFCKVNGVDVTAVVRERHEFHPGEAIRLRPKLTYLFDPSSGARLA
jgi:multiple sugar transport system ATP-binding protein